MPAAGTEILSTMARMPLPSPDPAMNDNFVFWLQRLLGSLKFRLAGAGLAALTLGIAVTTAMLVMRAEEDTLAARRQLELSESVRTARLLGMRVVGQQQALAAAATRLQVARIDDPAYLLSYMESQAVLREQFDSVFIAGADGIMRIIHDDKGYRQPSLSLADREYFRRAMAEGRPVVSEPVVSRLIDQPAIIMVQPLRNEAGEAGNSGSARPAGVLAAGLRLKARDLLAGVSDVTEGDEGVLVVVTDAQGRILAHANPALIGSPLAAEPQLAGALERWSAAGHPVEPAGLGFDTDERLVVTAGVAGPDWVVWRSRLRADVLAPLAAGRAAALRWAAAVVAALAAGLLVLLWWLLRPLARLQARAGHLFDGTQDPQAGWPGASGEIGRLEQVLRHVGAERAQLETVNRRMIRQLESVMAAAPVGIAFTRAQRFELVSRHFCMLLGREETALLGQPAQLIFASNEDYLSLGPQVGVAFTGGRPYAGEWELLRGDGGRFWCRLRAQPVDPKDAAAGTIWTASDITEEVATRSALEWAATHDPLTGLANRKAFDYRLARLFEALPQARPAALVLFDLDRFKPINDQHGHAAGDAMLRAVAAAAAARVRSLDLLVRLGGDEFAVVLERCPADVAARVAEDVRSAVSAVRLPWEGHLLEVGASVGVAALAESIADPAAWLQAADRACYAAKADGRGTVRHAGASVLQLVAGGGGA